MRSALRLGAVGVAALLAACAVAPSAPPRDPRLREDLGGFEPEVRLVDVASRLGEPATRDRAETDLAALSPFERVNALRAGLRLRDERAARACAARLTYRRIDRWECARCVELLAPVVLLEEPEASFEEFRSYLGSVELGPFLRSLPPLPWAWEPDAAIGTLHRIARAEHLPDYLALSRTREPEVAKAARADIGLLGLWNDDFREDVQRELLRVDGAPPVDESRRGGGLDPLLAAGMRWWCLDPFGSREVDPTKPLPYWDLRWLWESTPAAHDALLLEELAGRYPDYETGAGGAAIVLLGKCPGEAAEAALRKLADDDCDLAAWALARRGDVEMIARTAEDALAGEQFALAALMEADPPRARRLIEDTVFGADEERADEILEALEEFAVPGAWWEPLGFEWRRTSLDGFAERLATAPMPALRRALAALALPGCRTRAVAQAAAAGLASEGLPQDIYGVTIEAFGFLETAAPEALTASLRAIRRAGGDAAEQATEWLVAMGDAETAGQVAAEPTEGRWSWSDLARTRSPRVREVLEAAVRERLRTDESGGEWETAAGALAVWHGLPDEAAACFDTPSRAAAEAALDGRPVDALVAILAAAPDEPHGPVGLVDDPRVRAYLARLRERRDLELYWYATGQLAVLGDPGARADFWGAMQDGRYRIMDDAEEFERTLGWDLAATMPFWIEELRSQCCRMVTGSAGDIVEDVLGGEGAFDSRYRTPYVRATEVWSAARGRFVRSRIAGHWVPAPR